MKIRLAPGITVHQAPFSGAYALNRRLLAAAETDAELASLLSSGVLTHAALPTHLHAAVNKGVSEGWLVIEEDTP